mmetsp:Transcript_13137/g.19365  ORF Transcript_13137/g.19365 Transcript_13137/m.19365 type:complete len:227 (-) Transcript_13137:251-931(-)
MTDHPPMIMMHSFLEWIGKSRMSFYGHEDLNLPLWFGAACWGYAIAGITLLWTCGPKIRSAAAANNSNTCYTFPYRFFALELIFLQSPLSFCADYLNMTNDSIFHPLDRVVAITSMAFEAYKIATLPATNKFVVQAYVMAAILALCAFSKSQAAQEQLDRDGFVFWHTMWHMYPIVGSVIALVDYYCVGQQDQRGGGRTAAAAYRVEIHAGVSARKKKKMTMDKVP